MLHMNDRLAASSCIRPVSRVAQVKHELIHYHVFLMYVLIPLIALHFLRGGQLFS